MTYAYYHANVKPKPEAKQKTGYVCRICGYVYEGEELPPDFVCPWCKHGAEAFEKAK
jgi:rubrerythrin